eukprot:439205-Prorocentrum_minimum.AAC.1
MIPTAGPVSLGNMGRMDDKQFTGAMHAICPPKGTDAGPKLSLAETPGLKAIKAAWQEQEDDKQRQRASLKEAAANDPTGAFTSKQ